MAESTNLSVSEIYFMISFIGAIFLIGLSKVLSEIFLWRLSQKPRLRAMLYAQFIWIQLVAQTVTYAQAANVALLSFRRGGIPQAGVFFERFLPVHSATTTSLILFLMLIWPLKIMISEWRDIVSPFRGGDSRRL